MPNVKWVQISMAGPPFLDLACVLSRYSPCFDQLFPTQAETREQTRTHPMLNDMAFSAIQRLVFVPSKTGERLILTYIIHHAKRCSLMHLTWQSTRLRNFLEDVNMKYSSSTVCKHLFRCNYVIWINVFLSRLIDKTNVTTVFVPFRMLWTAEEIRSLLDTSWWDSRFNRSVVVGDGGCYIHQSHRTKMMNQSLFSWFV